MKGVIVSFAWLFAAATTSAQTARPVANEDALFREALTKRLAFIFKDEKLDRTHLGIEVYSLTRQESLFELNPDAPLSPASTIKLLTAVVGLKKLGPDYTYRTEVLADGPIQNGVLKGNLYLKGGGDPSLVSERMYLLVAEVLRSGIREITGTIFADDWVFEQIKVDPARIPTDTDRPYNAPIGGLSFNYNTTTVYFRPGDTLGAKPRVMVEPDTGYITVLNQAKTGRPGSGNQLVASRVKGKAGDTILVKGTLAQGAAEQRSYFNIVSPPLYAGYALRSYLEMRGVRVHGREIRHQQVPPSARKIAELESLPLREIVTLMNKFSNNFIAEVLVKTLGKEIRGAPGTVEKGLDVVREEATRLGINTAGFHVVSGSGLTRENRVSSRQFVQLMNAAYLDFDVLPELLSSLPIAGKDGTLRRRMKGTSAYGRLRAKTGSIDGVATLVGMVQARGGELLAFSVLMNDKTKDPGSMRPWQNYFGQALADFNRKTPLSEKPAPLPDTLEESSDPQVGGR